MNTKIRFVVGGALILGTAGYLMASSISETGMFWLTTSELSQRVESDPSFHNTGVKVSGTVVPGSIVRASNGRNVRFLATDGAVQMPVVYDKVPPDTFADSSDVILTGKLGEDGVFVATELLAKCASRFEIAPDSTNPLYRDAPAYPNAVKGAS